MKRKIITSIILTVFITLLLSTYSFANKTSVTIIAPEKAEKGSEITIKIEVKHIGNSKTHYTAWVKVIIDGEEYKKWEYSRNNLPPDQDFAVEFTIKAEKNMEIVVEGNCNKHGSKGSETVKVIVE